MSFKKLDTNKFIQAAKDYKSFDGYKCGVKSIDDIMRIDKQTLTTLVATPASGKSTFTNFYGYRMGVQNNWKTLYIATETPQDRQCRMLSILFQSAAKASEFSILYDYDFSNWQDLLDMIKDAKETYGVDMVVIDNFTMLQHLIGEINTTNIARALSDLKQASIVNDIAVILVTHPTKLIEGQEVTAYSVNGSANFYNISDFMFSLKISDYEAKETTIKVLKVRDSAKGVMGGKCVLKYNPVHLTYSDTDSTEYSDTDSQPVAQAGIQTAIPAPTQPAQAEEQPATAPAVKEEAKQHITPDFIYKTKVSIMEQHKVLKTKSLYSAVMMGRKHKDKIKAVRQIDRSKDEIAYKQAKEKVLSFTPSCLCPIGGSAKAENVEHVNPLIAVDLDEKDNKGISLEEMRRKINSLPYVMYSSMSVGGRGMYALIAIAEANKNDFKGVFKALESDFKALGLSLDSSCVNVNRERYMSYDDNEYWNTQCELYDKKISIPTQVNTTLLRGGDNANKPLTAREYNKVRDMVEDIKANKIQVSKNHDDTLGLANAIANVWGEEGRELLHIIRSQRSGYDEFKTDKTFDDMLYNNKSTERYGLGLIFDKYNKAKGHQTQVN